MNYRDELLELLVTKSLKKGEFTLASGKKSSYYIDGKKTTLDSRGAYLVARTFLAMLSDGVPDAVGGLTLGADPVIGSMLALAGMEDMDLRGFIVRKEAKSHGTRSRVEGRLKKGDRVVVIEDVVTTGGSAMSAIEALDGWDCEVVKVMAIVDRDEGGAGNLREAGYRLESIFTIRELLEA